MLCYGSFPFPILQTPLLTKYALAKTRVDSALAALSPTFSRMYASVGRPSIPPEHLLKGCLLMALFSVRSERQLCERLEYDMLFK